MLTGGKIFLEFLAGLVLTLFITFFLLKDGDRIWSWLISGLAPEAQAPARSAGGRAAWLALTCYVRGTIAVAAIHAVFIGLALWLLGVPLLVPLIILVFLAAFMPLVGILVVGALAIAGHPRHQGLGRRRHPGGRLHPGEPDREPPAAAAGGRAGWSACTRWRSSWCWRWAASRPASPAPSSRCRSPPRSSGPGRTCAAGPRAMRRRASPIGRALGGPAAVRVSPPWTDTVEVLIKRLDPGLPLPARAHPGDAGAGPVRRRRTWTLGPGERAIVGTGVAIALPDGYAAFVHPRSGLAARHGVTLVNAPGTVDAGYRGEIRVTLLNTDRRARGEVPARGPDRPAGHPARSTRAVLHEVDSLPGSARGEDGFGSTGGHAAGGGHRSQRRASEQTHEQAENNCETEEQMAVFRRRRADADEPGTQAAGTPGSRGEPVRPGTGGRGGALGRR